MFEQDRLFQKMLVEAKEGDTKASTATAVDGICKVCKMNSIIDSMEMDGESADMLGADDSLLLDDSIDEGDECALGDDDVRDSAEFRKGLI